MDDPFPEAQAEATAALTNAQQLFESYLRIKSTLPPSAQSNSEELSYAEAELKAVLSTLGSDVNDLEDAVDALETHGAASFGLSHATVLDRRRFVSGIREALDVCVESSFTFKICGVDEPLSLFPRTSAVR